MSRTSTAGPRVAAAGALGALPAGPLLALVCALLTIALCVSTPFGNVAWWGLPALAAGIALSEAGVVYLQFDRQRWTFSLTEGALAAAWVLHTGWWSVVSVAVGLAVAQRVTRRPAVKLAVNVAMLSLATAAGQALAYLAGGHVFGAAIGLGAFFVVNHTLVGLAVATTSHRRLLPLLVSSAPLSAVHTAGNSAVGLLAAFLATTAPLGLLGLLVPLALLWSSYDQETRRSQEACLFAELATGQANSTAPSSDVSAQIAVTTAARLFGGADVELVLLAADGPVRYVGDERGLPQRLRVGSAVFDEPWVLSALESRGVATGSQGGRPWCSAVLGAKGAPQAVLIARRPAGSVPFGRREARLAQVLVGHAATWLSVADLSARHRSAAEQVELADGAARAPSDLGAATAPFLTVLRESASRLARLAETAGGVENIVGELHLVERAVASLLGAVALAPEPDLLVGAGARTAARSATDWTTTGVLAMTPPEPSP